MELISNLFHCIYDNQYEILKNNEEYQTAEKAINELEENFVLSLTRKQRVLFRQYQAQQRALANLELRCIFSHGALLLALKDG